MASSFTLVLSWLLWENIYCNWLTQINIFNKSIKYSHHHNHHYHTSHVIIIIIVVVLPMLVVVFIVVVLVIFAM